MARRYYDVDVVVVQITKSEDYEAALFNGSCEFIIEHLEYLYAEAAKGAKVTMFCAPSKGSGLQLVVHPRVTSVEALKGQRLAVRSSGQPQMITLWLRMMGLEQNVDTLLIGDRVVGRWCQWKKVTTGECIGAFISPLYSAQAVAAGLKILPVPEIPVVGHYAHACLSEFARDNGQLLTEYLKALVHAVCLMIFCRADALKIVLEESIRPRDAFSREEMSRRLDAIGQGLQALPYPLPQAIANTYEIAVMEFPGARGLNPLSLWDLHWLKALDEEGFINHLTTTLAPSQTVASPDPPAGAGGRFV
jgi:hypothetical protein